MALSNALKDAMLTEAGTLVTKVSLHSADPGADGSANELSGGGYARQPITWGAASAGSMASSGTDPAFSVPASSTVAFVGFWDDAGTTFYGSDDVISETFTAAGTYTLDSATLSLPDPA